MVPNPEFTNLPPEFWSHIRFINQKIGYFERQSKYISEPDFIVPTPAQIQEAFRQESLSTVEILDSDGKLMPFGQKILAYFDFRKNILNNEVRPYLLNSKEAKTLFEHEKEKRSPKCPLPLNKQSGDKKDYAYFTGLINMTIESCLNGHSCDFDPRFLTTITRDAIPVRTLSRRLDGAFPSVVNPVAVWEIKEYYHTTSFGSRIADGVYETMLDGYELKEVDEILGIKVKHYLFIDAYHTWWDMGKSYLCRLVDILHMGLVDEIITGRQVLERIPVLAADWLRKE